MQIMKLIKLIYSQLLSANKYAEISGVNMGRNCRLRTKYFGSEPYLITLGDNVATARNVQFITHDGSVNVLRNMDDNDKNIDLIKPIVVGNNVFIGINTVILPGSKIGSNVIIGAGSIVRGDIGENGVYAGAPVKFICSLEAYKNKNSSYFTQTKSMSKEEKKTYLKKLYSSES